MVESLTDFLFDADSRNKNEMYREAAELWSVCDTCREILVYFYLPYFCVRCQAQKEIEEHRRLKHQFS